MKLKIYVVTHKKVDYPLPENYSYIFVGAKGKENPYEYGDDRLDNISEKNKYYCELTAAYWIYKNDKENDIVGLAHYRRFFTTNRFSKSIKSYLNKKRIEKDLSKYDFIATKLFTTKCSVKEHMEENVHSKDLDILEDAIKKVSPDYLESYHSVLNGNNSYLVNMFITKKKLWDEYYQWLFSIFDEMEKHVNMENYTIQEQRLYGFLSERLFTVYVRKHNYKVKSYPVHLVGEPMLRIIRQKIALKLGLKQKSQKNK